MSALSNRGVDLLSTRELREICSKYNVEPTGDKRLRQEWVSLKDCLTSECARDEHNANYREMLTRTLNEAREDQNISFDFAVLVESLERLVNPSSRENVQESYSLSKELGGGKSGDVVLMVTEHKEPKRTHILKTFVTSPSKVSLEVVLHRRINNVLNVGYLPNMMPGILKSGYLNSEDLQRLYTTNKKTYPGTIKSNKSYPFLIMESFQDSKPLEVFTAQGKILLTGTLSTVVQSLCGKFNKSSRPTPKIQSFLKSVLWQLAYIVFKLNANNIQHCDLQTNNIILRTVADVKDDNKWSGIAYNNDEFVSHISVGIIDAGLSTEDRPCKKLRSLSSSIREDLQICHAPLAVLVAKTRDVAAGELFGSGSVEVDNNFYQNILLIFELGGLIQVEEKMRTNLETLKKFLENNREPCVNHPIQILSNPFEEIGQVQNCQCILASG